LSSVLGRDGTALFEKYHRWVNQDGLIGKLQIGYVEKKRPSESLPSYLPSAMKTNDGFAMPAPRPPKKVATASLLPDDDDSKEEDIL
jgi:hypothetical protein